MASSNPWPRKAAGLAGIAVGLLGCAAGGYAGGPTLWEGEGLAGFRVGGD